MRGLAAPLGIAISLSALATGCASPGGAPRAAASAAADRCAAGIVPATSSASREPAFPIRVDPDRGVLVDAGGAPFLLQGDAAWSLIAQLDGDDVATYLDARKASGFNAVLVNLIEHEFATNAPANIAGEAPFSVPGDFSTPNPAYFDFADSVVQAAEERGMAVLLAAAYIGYDGTTQGWWSEMQAAGTDVLTDYGRFLGDRFGHHQNIVWVNGGDANPSERELVVAIAEGLRETDADALQTAHNAPETAAADFWGAEAWLDLNTVYTYGDTYSPSIAQFEAGHVPFIMFESTYENEHDATSRQLRAQAYQSILSGATGQIFGNNPVWHFDAEGLFDAGETWQAALSSPGTASMTALAAIFEQLPWWTLVPDADGELIVEGAGSGHDRAVAASSCDRRLAVAYVPAGQSLTLDMGSFGDLAVTAQWIDPTTGEGTEPTTMSTSDPVDVAAPGANAGGDADWVLLVRAA